MAVQKQVTIRLDDELRTAFATICAAQGLSMQQVIETYIDNAVHYHNSYETRHLDGSLCPLSAMLQGLTTELTKQLVQHRRFDPAPQGEPRGWTLQRNEEPRSKV